jgi:negative regulator of sigma E activity
MTMKDINREQLSAFLDDELDAGEAELLVRRLSGDFDLRGAALRYGVIGDVIRDDLLPGDPRVLPRQVGAAIEDEPIPKAGVSVSRFLRPMAGAVVAASVAALAIFAVSETDRGGPDTTTVTVPETPVAIVAPGAAPAAAIFRAGSPSQLSRYYLNHSEYATMLGGQGTLIRIVRAPEDDPAPDEEREAAEEIGDKTVE